MFRRNAKALRVLRLALLLAPLVRPAAVSAADINEFDFPEVADTSKQASAKLLDAVVIAFQAARQAELGATAEANGRMREAIGTLGGSRRLFEIIAEKMKTRPLNYAKAPKEISGAPITRIFQVYKIPLPKTTADLAKLAISEIDPLQKSFEQMKFGDRSYSRAAFFRFNNVLHRTLKLAVLISALADTAQPG